MLSRAEACNTNARIRFVCVYASSTLPFIAVWINVFDRFGHNRFGFNRLQISAALEINYFAFEIFCLLPFLASVSHPQGPFDYNCWRSERG